MIIAFVITESYCINKYNGIRMQAEIWAQELTRKGHVVQKISPWCKYDWSKFDIIHIFGPCEHILNFTNAVGKTNTHIVFSPIIDTIKSRFIYKLATLCGNEMLRLSSPNYIIRKASPNIAHWIARSSYEQSYIERCYSVDKQKTSVVPLSYRMNGCVAYPEKEDFCLHVSILTNGRKNVKRLILAAIKYNFKLVLAGGIENEEMFTPLKDLIDSHDNLEYHGRVSDDELVNLYKRAKVFALPSINEGVGMVAVEAAAHGCDIVVTKYGGPKEYYADYGFVVNPYDIDEIGMAVNNALMSHSRQPRLMEHIKSNYNLSTCVDTLLSVYNRVKQ